MNESQLRERLLKLFPPAADVDWDDVLARAKRPAWSFRRLALLVAAAILAVLAVGSALALSGRLGGLFHGTAVNDVTPREGFLLSEFDMNGKVELIAKRNASAFYLIRRSDGRLCYSIGDIRKNLTPAQAEGRMRFGGGGCIDPRVFPSKAMPVLNFSSYAYRPGDAEWRLVGLRGFAADPVDRIGVIGRNNRIDFSVRVDNNVYTAGQKAFPGGRGIVALDKDGKVLWVQCQAIGTAHPRNFPNGGCGTYTNSPPPNLPPATQPTKPAKPTGPVVVQRGSDDGVSIIVRGAQISAGFARLTAEKRQLLVFKDGRINLGCFELVTVGAHEYSRSFGVTTPFAPTVRTRFSPLGESFTAPFDGCTVAGRYGHTWNDRHGTHDTVEIALTAKGRRFFAERAVARDITWLARARVFRDIRYARHPLATDEVARRLGSHVVPLNSPRATPPIGKLGVWVGDHRRIILVERTTTQRRLYLEIRHGIPYRTNLLGLS